MKLIGQLTQEKYQILEQLANCRRGNALELWWENYREELLVEMQGKVKDLEAKNKDLTRRTEEAEEKIRCKLPRECSLKIRVMKEKMEADMEYLKGTNQRLTKLVGDLQSALGKAREKVRQLQEKVKNLNEELMRTEESSEARMASAVKEAREEMREENLREVEAIISLLDSVSEERDSWKVAFERSEQEKEEEIARRVAEAVEDVRREFEAATPTAAQLEKDKEQKTEIASLRRLVEMNTRRLSEVSGIAAKNEWLTKGAANMAYWINDAVKKQEEKGPPTTRELKAFYDAIVDFTHKFTEAVDSRIFEDGQ